MGRGRGNARETATVWRRRPPPRARLHRRFSDSISVLLPAVVMLIGAWSMQGSSEDLDAATRARRVAAIALRELRTRVADVDRALSLGDVARADSLERALRRWLRAAHGRLPEELAFDIERTDEACWLRVARRDEVEDDR